MTFNLPDFRSELTAAVCGSCSIREFGLKDPIRPNPNHPAAKRANCAPSILVMILQIDSFLTPLPTQTDTKTG